jgi:secreted trypsin-like serine protease
MGKSKTLFTVESEPVVSPWFGLRLGADAPNFLLSGEICKLAISERQVLGREMVSGTSRFSSKVLALVASLAVAGASFSPEFAEEAQAVTYGEEIVDASISKAWVASIWFAAGDDEYLDFICTGSLIEKDVVLTAAHCVDEPGRYAVQLRADTLESNWLFINSSAEWSSPRYDKRKIQNDIGLILLETPVVDFSPIPIADKTLLEAVDSQTSFTVYGWGEDQNGDVASFLRFSDLKSQTKAAKKFFSARLFNSKTTIAAGRYLKGERVYSGACYGDSGGPLTANILGVETLVGITSYGAVSCRAKVPSVFTKVPYYEKDILQGIKVARARAALNN